MRLDSWIDFRELRKRLDFAEVLRHYGVTPKAGAEQYHGFCPLPSHEGKRNSPSFSANLKRGIWQCFGCGKKGNVLDFAVLMERGNPESGEDLRRVASELKERFLQGAEQTAQWPEPTEVPKNEENIVINAPLDFELQGLDASHPYLLDRGFSNETIARFNLGYCSRGLLRDRIAIPLHNGEGNLVGYAGRVVDDSAISEDNPKYRFPGQRKRKGVIYEFRKSLLVYNAHRIAAPVDDLVVVEGFSGVWWLSQAGIPNVVAPMGASCSEEQAKIIVSLLGSSGRLWILTDGDAAGERCAAEVFSRVAPHRAVRWAKLENRKQPTDIGAERLKELLPFAGL